LFIFIPHPINILFLCDITVSMLVFVSKEYHIWCRIFKYVIGQIQMTMLTNKHYTRSALSRFFSDCCCLRMSLMCHRFIRTSTSSCPYGHVRFMKQAPHEPSSISLVQRYGRHNRESYNVNRALGSINGHDLPPSKVAHSDHSGFRHNSSCLRVYSSPLSTSFYLLV
jgi:hypothetical protein